MYCLSIVQYMSMFGFVCLFICLFVLFSTGCQILIQTRALQDHFKKCTFQTTEFIVKHTDYGKYHV